MQIYLVGGAVRDQLLGLSVKEKDYVVVGATPQQMLDQNYKLVGKDFPVFLHPQTHDEYALARTERKIGPGYTGFSCYAAPDVKLEDDLLRRDLTINAMAQDANGNIIDPFNGQNDLNNKILRHVSPAFVEDPVRILRIARFAARFKNFNFHIASETLLLMQQMVDSGEVNALVPERVWQEFFRALQEDAPQEFILVLRNCGALKILFPELDCLFGVPNPPQWHPEIDTGIHVLMVLQQAAKLTAEPIVRFAALLHDLGKGVTPKEVWPHHPGHGEAGVPLINNICDRFLIPRDYRDLAILGSRFHPNVHRAFELNPTTIVSTLEQLDAFRRPDRFQQFLLVCEADYRGRSEFQDRPYPQREFFQRAYQAANNVDIKTIVARGLQNEVLKNAIHEARVESIKSI